MSIFQKGLGKALGASWPAILVGAGAVIIAPKIISMGFRPLVKAGVRGFMDARDKVGEWATEAEESWRDLAAEAEAETGAGETVAATAAEGGMRGVMRAAMRGVMNLRNKVRETTSEASEKWNDLVAEVKAERERGMEEEEDAGGETSARAENEAGEAAEEPPARTRRRSRKRANGSRTRTRGSRPDKA